MGRGLWVWIALAAAGSGATPGPKPELVTAVGKGDRSRVEALLRDGADPDARDREAGTALDLAEKAGRRDIADLLRAHGARGSGKSVGDLVCVTPWDASGFCGRVESRRDNRHGLIVLWLEGCADGCAPDAQCSAGRPVGGATGEAVRAGSALVVPTWCLTRTGVAAPRR